MNYRQGIALKNKCKVLLAIRIHAFIAKHENQTVFKKWFKFHPIKKPAIGQQTQLHKIGMNFLIIAKYSRFFNNSEIDTLISKRLSAENKAKLS